MSSGDHGLDTAERGSLRHEASLYEVAMLWEWIGAALPHDSAPRPRHYCLCKQFGGGASSVPCPLVRIASVP